MQIFTLIPCRSFLAGNASFRIDFQVFKSMAYEKTYGTDEFPIYLSMRSRIYFELSMDREQLNIIPQNCYATKTRSYMANPKYYLIQER